VTVKTNSRVAGFAFLFYIVMSLLPAWLLRPISSAVGTAAKLTAMAAHPTLTRSGALFSLIAMVNAIVLGAALYALTRFIDRDLALIALLFRVAEGVLSPVGAFTRRALLMIATEPAPNIPLADVLLKTQGFSFLLGSTCFAAGSTLFAFLFLRSRSIPVWLAWLGFLGSLLILIGLPLQILAVLPAPFDSLMWIPIAFFEVIFAIWLFFREPQIPQLQG
jgi:hypothetical protein